MTNLLTAFNANGNFDGELWYVTLFNEIPCKYSLGVEDESKQLDPETITFDKCKHLFPKDVIFRSYTEQAELDPDEEEIEFDGEVPIPLDIEEVEGSLRLGGEQAGSLYICTDHRVYYITFGKCIVFFSPNDSLEEIRKFIPKLWDCFPKAKEEEKTARVGLIKYANGEYYTSFSNIRKTKVNIEENYNDDFIPVYEDVVKFLNQRESGLILLYGKAGSGNFYKNNLDFSKISCIFVSYGTSKTQLYGGTGSGVLRAISWRS